MLDYKVASGYDFDAKHEEEEARRIEDTLQVVSLSLSNLGGPEVIGEYFATNGNRGYEDRVYRYFAEFYLTKRRYNDAAIVYRSFVALYPRHVVAPHFGMRVIEIYDQGGFSKLVLESKKDFATRYGLHAEYWQYFDVNQSPDVLSYVKSNLKDLANHYHAQYQDASKADEKPTNFAEATHWYRELLDSFHDDPEAPPINYQLADLLREQQDFAGAAQEYERTAYDYPAHEKAAAAGYAAIYAHREYLKVVSEDAEARGKARHRHEFASIRRYVPAARACGGGTRRRGRRSVRDAGLPAREKLCAAARSSVSRTRTRASFVEPGSSPRTRPSISPSTAKRSRRMRACLPRRPSRTSRIPRSSKTSRRRSTSKASTRTKSATIARRQTTSCASSRSRRRRRSARVRNTTPALR